MNQQVSETELINFNLYSDFPMQIEKIVKEQQIPYIDAVLVWCDRESLEYYVGGELVKKSEVLLGKITNEAEDLNFVPKTARLPF